MRYTEEKQTTEVNDILDVIRLIFSSMFTAPFRLINEVSSKLMFLERNVVEKLLLLTTAMTTALLVWDAIVFFINGDLRFMSGMMPVMSKFVVLILTAFFGFYLLKNYTFPYEITKIEEPTYEETTSIVEEEVELVESPQIEEVEEEPEPEPIVKKKVPVPLAVPVPVPIPVPVVEDEEEEEEVSLFDEVVAINVEDLAPPPPPSLRVLEEITLEPYTKEMPATELQLDELELYEDEEESVPFISAEDRAEMGWAELETLGAQLDYLNMGKNEPDSVESLTAMLSDNTLFSHRKDEELMVDIGTGMSRKLANLDKPEEDF